MLNVSFVRGEIDSECQELNCTDVCMWKEDKLHYVVHAVGIG